MHHSLSPVFLQSKHARRTSFFMAAQNSWLVSPPDPLLSSTCRHPLAQ
jgi:hypothetical protein